MEDDLSPAELLARIERLENAVGVLIVSLGEVIPDHLLVLPMDALVANIEVEK